PARVRRRQRRRRGSAVARVGSDQAPRARVGGRRRRLGIGRRRARHARVAACDEVTGARRARRLRLARAGTGDRKTARGDRGSACRVRRGRRQPRRRGGARAPGGRAGRPAVRVRQPRAPCTGRPGHCVAARQCQVRAPLPRDGSHGARRRHPPRAASARGPGPLLGPRQGRRARRDLNASRTARTPSRHFYPAPGTFHKAEDKEPFPMTRASQEPAGLVLIVEDNRNISEMVGEYLEGRGFEVDYASDGLDGYRLASENSYDVVVLDLMLPRLDGVEVCKRLREEARKSTPVLMLTARDTLDEKLTGLSVGADDYLTKP